MLQRQIMFKQIQEMQRRQQLQDMGEGRKQNYVNQLPSLKQASGSQFHDPINGATINDSSQMFMVGNMDMIQRGGSATFQGFSNGLGLSQPQDLAGHPLGFSQQQFGVPLYSHLGGSSNDSTSLLNMKNSSPLEIPTMQPSAFGNSVVSQRSNFSSDQVCIPGALLPNQVYEEKNLFEQGLVQGFNEGTLHENYSQQGNSQQRNTSIPESEERQKQAGFHGLAPGNVPKPGLFLQPGTSLDPLEQKILYNTDENVDAGGFTTTLELTAYMDELPSSQSGSWSALMQSAVAETSSGDTGVKEGWSGLSIQNPEPPTENKASNYIDSGKQQNNWVDLPSSKSEPFFHNNSNMNYSFPGFQQSGDQYLKQREESLSESSHSSIQQSPRNTNKWSDYSPQQKHLVEGSQMIQTSSPVPNFWHGQHHEHLKNDTDQSSFLSYSNVNGPFSSLSGHDSRDRLHRSTPQHVTGVSQKPFDQVHQPKNQMYSIESTKMSPGNNFVPMSSSFGSLSHPNIQNVTAQTSESMLDLLNKDDISIEHAPGKLNKNDSTPNEASLTETSASFGKSHNISSVTQGFGLRLGLADQQTPQSYSFFQTLSENSSATLPSSHSHLQNRHPSAPPVTSHWASKFPAYDAAVSQDNGPLKSAHLYDKELPVLGSVPVTQPSLASGVSQHVGLPMGLSNVWPDLLLSSDLALSSLQDTTGPSNEQHKQENSVHEYGAYSGKSDLHELHSGKEGSHQYGSAGVDSPISRSRSTHEHESMGKHHLEADVTPGSLMQHSNMARQKGNQTSSVPARDAGAFGNSLIPLYSLPQNHSFLQPVQMHPNLVEGDSRKRLSIKCDGVDFGINNQQPGQKSGVNDVEKNDSFSSGNNKAPLNFCLESQDDQSGKISSQAYLRDSQQMAIFGQNDTQSPSSNSNVDSKVTRPSEISLQMAPSWFKHYGTLKTEQMQALLNANAEITAVHQISGSPLPNLPTNSSIMQVNSASQGSTVWPITVASKQLSPTNVLPSDATYQNLAISRPKKRKINAFELVPWHKEVTQNSRRLQNISTAELEWAHATNNIFEEVKMEAIVSEDTHPVVRAKRRLIFTTQLMQQVFRPPPTVILSADASSNYDFMAYFAARLTLGDACSLATNSQFPSDTNDKSPEKLKTSKRTGAYDFSKVAEGFTNQMKILKGNMLRLDKSLSITNIKAESQELEKLSIINRLAKFHSRGGDTASSSGSIQKHLQRYVIAVPMPKTVPEGTNCLLL